MTKSVIKIEYTVTDGVGSCDTSVSTTSILDLAVAIAASATESAFVKKAVFLAVASMLSDSNEHLAIELGREAKYNRNEKP